MKENSETIFGMGDHERTLQSEYEDISMKTKISLSRFVLTFEPLRKWWKYFFTLLGSTPFSDHNHNITILADSPGVCRNGKTMYLKTLVKNLLKCVVIDGSGRNGVKQPKLYSFLSSKAARYKMFCHPETIRFEKLNKSVLNTLTLF